MKVESAIELAGEYNRSGKHREHWFYYPAYHVDRDQWFVARRQKSATIVTAVFSDGSINCHET